MPFTSQEFKKGLVLSAMLLLGVAIGATGVNHNNNNNTGANHACTN
jgi:hypothetical protein